MLGSIAAVVSIAGGLNSLFGGDSGGDASDAATRAADTSSAITAAQWNYYLNNYQPLETSLIKQATEAGSPEEFARARGAAVADVTGAFDQSRKQTLNRMQSFGINPGSPAYQSTGASIDLAEGATKAGALTMADRNTRNLAYSKGLDVVGLGRNIPAQSAASSATAANAATMASRNQFLTNESNMKNAGYGLNTIGTAAAKWFGVNRDQPVNTLAGGTSGSYSNWGNDDGYAEGGMIEAEKTGEGEYDATKLKAVLQSRGLNPMMAHGQAHGAAKRRASLTPHMRRFAHGGGVGRQGMEMRDMSDMGGGAVMGPGTETSDSIAAEIDGEKPAAL